MSALLYQMKQDSPRVLYMMSDSSGSIIDYSGNGFHGTVTGSAGYRYANVVTGLPGLRLNGTSQYVGFSSDLNWGPGQAFSISMWVMLNSTSGTNASHLFSKSSSGSSTTGFYVQPSSGQGLIFNVISPADEYIEQVSDQTGTSSGTIAPFSLNKPRHLVVTYNSSNQVRYWLDGARPAPYMMRTIGPGYGHNWDPDAVTATSRVNSGSERIGQHVNTSWSSGDLTFGPVAIYQSELSAARVKAHYQAGLRAGVSY